jgi:hypothetical protein
LRNGTLYGRAPWLTLYPESFIIEVSDMEHKQSPSGTRIALVSGLVLGALALAIFGFIAAKDATQSGKLKINVGKNSIEMGFEKEGLRLTEILVELFKDPDQQRETYALLREFNELYELRGTHLIQTISAEPADSDLSINIRDLLFSLQGPFARNYHKFYDVETESVVEAIAGLDYDHKVAKLIRELRAESKGPFEERIKPVRIGILEDDMIATGYAAVCRDGEYFREQIYLFEANYEKIIIVNAFEPRLCPKVVDARVDADPPLVRISRADAKRLFGDRPLSKTEVGFAQITWKPPMIEAPQKVAASTQS